MRKAIQFQTILLTVLFSSCSFSLIAQIGPGGVGGSASLEEVQCRAASYSSTQSDGGYTLVAIVEGIAGECHDSCTFNVRWKVMLDDGNGGLTTVGNTGDSTKDAQLMNDWHGPGQSINWGDDASDAASTSSAHKKQFIIKCGSNKTVTGSLNTSQPVTTNPCSSNPGSATVSISVQTTLICTDCRKKKDRSLQHLMVGPEGGIVFGLGKLGDYTEESHDQVPAMLGNIYPNPSYREVTVPVSIPKHNESARLFLFDINGKIVRHYMIQGYGEIDIISDVTNLASGVYHYSFEVDGMKAGTKKLLVSK